MSDVDESNQTSSPEVSESNQISSPVSESTAVSVDKDGFPTSAEYLIVGAGTAALKACQVIKGREPRAKVWITYRNKSH